MTASARPARPAFPVTVTVPADLADSFRDQVAEAAASGLNRVLGALALPGRADVKVREAVGFGLGFGDAPAQASREAEHQALALAEGWRQMTEPSGQPPVIDSPAKIAEFIRRWAAAAATRRVAELLDGTQIAALWGELRALRELPAEPYDWMTGLVLAVWAAGGSLAERGALADALADAGPEPGGLTRAAEYVAERSAADQLTLAANPASVGHLVQLVHGSLRTLDSYYGALLGATLSWLMPSPGLAVDDDVPAGFVVIRVADLDAAVLPLPDPGTLLVPLSAAAVAGQGAGLVAAAVVPGEPDAEMAFVATESPVADWLAGNQVADGYYLAFELVELVTANAARLAGPERLASLLDIMFDAADHANTVWFARNAYGSDELLIAVRELLRAAQPATALPILLRELTLQDGDAPLNEKVTAAVDGTRRFLNAG